LAKGLCFTCGEPGHLSRNCPKNNSVPSNKKGKLPGFSTHAVRLGSGSASQDEQTDGSMPALRSVTDSSDSGSYSGALSEYSDSIAYGDPQETLEDRFRIWGCALEHCEPRGPVPPRARRLGDVLGNTVAALLEFFQPYPGDERVPWSDDRRDAVRFHVLSPGGENLVIEDSFFDEVTVLPLEYLRVPHFYFLEWFAGQRASSLGVKNMDTLP
ncbi:hypothetical protein B0H10DRAFT_1732475, partial [Mycena sp. CBHHK59/15]